MHERGSWLTAHGPRAGSPQICRRRRVRTAAVVWDGVHDPFVALRRSLASHFRRSPTRGAVPRRCRGMAGARARRGAAGFTAVRRRKLRAVVSGAELPGRCLLRVRERRGEDPPRDRTLRRDAASEHVVGVVRGLPARRVRGREWDAVLLLHADRRSSNGSCCGRRVARGEATTILLGGGCGCRRAARDADGRVRTSRRRGRVRDRRLPGARRAGAT